MSATETSEEIELGLWAQSALSRCQDVETAADDVLLTIQRQKEVKRYLRALARGFVRGYAETMESPQGGAESQEVGDTQPGPALSPSTQPSAGAAAQTVIDTHCRRGSSDYTPAQPVGSSHGPIDTQASLAAPVTTPLGKSTKPWAAPIDAVPPPKATPTGSGQEASDRATPMPGAPPSRPAPIQRPALLSGVDLKRITLNRMTAIGKTVGKCSRADLESLAAGAAVDAGFYAALAASMPHAGKVEDFMDEKEAADILHKVRTKVGIEKKVVIDAPWVNDKARRETKGEYHA